MSSSVFSAVIKSSVGHWRSLPGKCLWIDCRGSDRSLLSWGDSSTFPWFFSSCPAEHRLARILFLAPRKENGKCRVCILTACILDPCFGGSPQGCLSPMSFLVHLSPRLSRRWGAAEWRVCVRLALPEGKLGGCPGSLIYEALKGISDQKYLPHWPATSPEIPD